jgi:hypothetical protein
MEVMGWKVTPVTRPLYPFIVKWTSSNGYETLPNATLQLKIQFIQIMLQNMAWGSRISTLNSKIMEK